MIPSNGYLLSLFQIVFLNYFVKMPEKCQKRDASSIYGLLPIENGKCKTNTDANLREIFAKNGQN